MPGIRTARSCLSSARAAVQSLNKSELTQIAVEFRGGTYFLLTTQRFISGGARVQNWTNVSGNIWKTSLPASTKYFANMFSNGVRPCHGSMQR